MSGSAPNRSDAAPASLTGFWALIATQFQGALGDNTLKWLVSFMVVESAVSREERDLWFVLIVPLLFSVPFLLFSVPGGFVADKYSKRSVTIATVCGQVLVMSLAAWALAHRSARFCGRRAFFDEHPRSDFWTDEIWIASGVVAGDRS